MKKQNERYNGWNTEQGQKESEYTLQKLQSNKFPQFTDRKKTAMHLQT